MNTGNAVMPPHAPTPDEAESAKFFIEWWSQILSGTIIILTGWFLKAKGKKGDAIIPLSEKDIQQRMLICKQEMLLDIHEMLDERDDKFLEKIETLHIRLNREAGIK